MLIHHMKYNTLVLGIMLMPVSEPVGRADMNLNISHPCDTVNFNDRLLEVRTGILVGDTSSDKPQRPVVGGVQIQS